MTEPREPRSIHDVRDAAGDDALLLWAAGDLARGTRAFSLGAATAVAAPALSCRDRLAVAGPAADASALVRALLPQIGPTFRPIGDEGLIRDLATRLPELEFVDAFGWMDTATATIPRTASASASAPAPAPLPAWLTDSDHAAITSLLDEAFPDSYARPDRPGTRRWAGVRDEAGVLLACAADAWSAPRVGFLAGVATAERARGCGLGAAVCGLVLDGLVTEHGRAALMVDSWNTAAVRLYRGLGLSWRPLAAARVTGH